MNIMYLTKKVYLVDFQFFTKKQCGKETYKTDIYMNETNERINT